MTAVQRKAKNLLEREIEIISKHCQGSSQTEIKKAAKESVLFFVEEMIGQLNQMMMTGDLEEKWGKVKSIIEKTK
jgi:hypothetical protein